MGLVRVKFFAIRDLYRVKGFKVSRTRVLQAQSIGSSPRCIIVCKIDVDLLKGFIVCRLLSHRIGFLSVLCASKIFIWETDRPKNWRADYAVQR
jgi:hypothetical protein